MNQSKIKFFATLCAGVILTVSPNLFAGSPRAARSQGGRHQGAGAHGGKNYGGSHHTSSHFVAGHRGGGHHGGGNHGGGNHGGGGYGGGNYGGGSYGGRPNNGHHGRHESQGPRLGVGYGGGYWGGGYGGGMSLMYRNGYIPIPPYFALHPPVYYSAPVGRTYGYSPFPYSGNVPTPEVIVESTVKSKIIENPHAAPMKQASEPVDQPAEDSVAEVPPQVVRNPYFEPSPLDGDIHVAKTIEN